MDKKSYIDHEIMKLLQSWGSIILPSGIFVIGLLILLDYLVTREHFFQFLVFRTISIGLFVILFFLNNRYLRKNLQLGFTIAATVIVSSMVELMILATGGHASSYYVGMMLTYVFIIGLLPISLPVTFLLAGIIYSIYLFPIFMFDTTPSST